MPALAPVVLVADIGNPEALDMAPVATAVPLAPVAALLAPVAPAEAGQLAAEGNVTLTLNLLLVTYDPPAHLSRRRRGIGGLLTYHIAVEQVEESLGTAFSRSQSPVFAIDPLC